MQDQAGPGRAESSHQQLGPGCPPGRQCPPPPSRVCLQSLGLGARSGNLYPDMGCRHARQETKAVFTGAVPDGPVGIGVNSGEHAFMPFSSRHLTPAALVAKDTVACEAFADAMRVHRAPAYLRGPAGDAPPRRPHLRPR